MKWRLLAFAALGASLMVAVADEALYGVTGPRAWAQSTGTGQEAVSQPAQNTPKKPQSLVFVPPKRGAPTRRVGGAKRGEGESIPLLVTLAPEDTGWTVRAQPTLYWYISVGSDVPVELTVVDPNEIDPVVKVRIPAPVKPGIWAFPLGEYGAQLEPGIEYEWYVALILNPQQRSKDIVSSATIRRVELPARLTALLGATRPEDHVYLYAKEGLWYEAIAAISAAISKRPAVSDLYELRATLLDQVDLPEVAEADRRI